MTTTKRAATARARQRRAQLELERQRARTRRNRIRLAAGSFGAVLVVLVVMVIVRVASSPSSGNPAAGSSTAISSTVLRALAVSPTVLDQVGRGSVDTGPKKISAPEPLTVDGKPLVLYVGAEYCPFCAGQRWALVVALSRFGSFTDLKNARSAADDVYPNTATVSFYGATYTSDYLAFQGVELATSERAGNSYRPLQSLTAAQEKIVRTYNAPPYVEAGSAGAVPFVDFGNRYLMTGSAFSPGLLKGLTQEQIATALSQPDSEIAQAVLGAANAMTAALCDLTGAKPAAVCSSPAVTANG